MASTGPNPLILTCIKLSERMHCISKTCRTRATSNLSQCTLGMAWGISILSIQYRSPVTWQQPDGELITLKSQQPFYVIRGQDKDTVKR